MVRNLLPSNTCGAYGTAYCMFTTQINTSECLPTLIADKQSFLFPSSLSHFFPHSILHLGLHFSPDLSWERVQDICFSNAEPWVLWGYSLGAGGELGGASRQDVGRGGGQLRLACLWIVNQDPTSGVLSACRGGDVLLAAGNKGLEGRGGVGPGGAV